LLEWLEGHPLSLRLLLPHLEQVSAAALLAGLKGNTGALPPGFVGAGRTRSLGASLAYSFDHLAAEDRERAWALGLFEGVAVEVVLRLFSAAEGAPRRFAGVGEEAWAGLLQRLAAVGLLSRLGASIYELHPALPAWLMAAWRESAGADFAAERAAADDALLTAYAAMGNWLLQQIHGGAAELAFALLDRQRATMGRLLGQALTGGRYAEAQALMQPLDEFWNVRGLDVEADGWVDRCRNALEQADGTAPGFDSAAGALWRFAVGAQANRAEKAGDLDAAAATHDAIRVSLEASKDEAAAKPVLAAAYHELGIVAQLRGDLAAGEEWYWKALAIWEALGDRRGLARNYHQLGTVAQFRGDPAAAEQWYRKSLEIKEALGDRPGLASSYHQLGTVAEDRGDLAAAEQCYRKSLEIKEALGDRPGLSSSYHQLGTAARRRGDLAAAEQWYQKALVINEALANRPGLAMSYILLGLLAEGRGDTAAALDWTVRCVALFPEFPHRATGPGPRHLVRLTGILGLAALESSWQRCTGAALPPVIAQAVSGALKDSSS
jgi:tetratricopeptide (TPR) repeat protein